MDMRQEITNALIAMIEEGRATQSQPLWDCAVKFGLPVNYASKRPYTGINVSLLWIAAAKRGCARNEWLTFKQAQELKATVRKGAKGVMCVFFKMVPKKDGGESGEEVMAPMMKPFWLFNVADIDGLPEEVNAEQQPGFAPIEAAERILKASGAGITHGGSRAFYHTKLDRIFMPDRDRFAKAQNYYAVGLHELTHWSGHPSRLERDFSGSFGSDSYAFEELVAELGSAYLVAHLGLQDATLESHASYLDSWLRVLKSDKNAIFAASRQANAAYQFILQQAGVATPSCNA